MNPFTYAIDAQSKFWDRASDDLERGDVVPDRIEQMTEVEVGQTPSEVVYRENKLELHHYEPDVAPEERQDVPILVVYALINRPYILDLQPGRSVVRRLLEAGFDVYLIDWGEPSQLDTSLALHDYVDRYLYNCVETVCERHDLDAVNLLGYCMGGTMSVMYAARYPETVRNLGLMAAGLCFTGTGGVLELWGDEEHYDPEAIADTYGNVPAEFLDVGFALMDPVNNYVTKYFQLYENIDDEEFVENFARMERWLNDGIDVAGTAYREFLEEIYQKNKLHRNELELDGEPVDLANIDMPVLQIIGEYDHLIPPEASKPFNDVVASDDTETMEFATGHIGLSVSRSSHGDLWPHVAEWYAERSEVAVEPDDTAADTENGAEAVDEPDDTVADSADVEVERDAPAPEEAGATGADLQTLEGLGPKYAERLATAGVETIDDLASADPAGLAVETGIDESRIRSWIEHAIEADLQTLEGIGPKYAERLATAGVETIGDLASADPAELAVETGIGESRIRSWIERASER